MNYVTNIDEVRENLEQYVKLGKQNLEHNAMHYVPDWVKDLSLRSYQQWMATRIIFCMQHIEMTNGFTTGLDLCNFIYVSRQNLHYIKDAVLPSQYRFRQSRPMDKVPRALLSIFPIQKFMYTPVYINDRMGNDILVGRLIKRNYKEGMPDPEKQFAAFSIPYHIAES